MCSARQRAQVMTAEATSAMAGASTQGWRGTGIEKLLDGRILILLS
jgi:hypothetical protein